MIKGCYEIYKKGVLKIEKQGKGIIGGLVVVGSPTTSAGRFSGMGANCNRGFENG